jgi:YfiH family protein
VTNSAGVATGDLRARDPLVARDGVVGRYAVEVGFTDDRLDLGDRAPAAARAAGLRSVATATGASPRLMRQVHGATVARVAVAEPASPPEADALVTLDPGVALLTRAADCVPVLLADPQTGVLAAAHAGRLGVQRGVVPAVVAAMRRAGADDIVAWVGPHVCAGCYEVPEALRAAVAAVVPETWATTREGTPALDLGSGVRAQLDAAGCAVRVVPGCTREDAAWPSYRRDGAAAGRFAGVVWRRR